MTSRLSRRSRTVAVAVLLAAFAAPAAIAAPSQGQRLLVQFAPGTSAATTDRALAAAGASRAGTVRGLGISIVRGPAGALDALRRNRAVRRVEVDSVLLPQEQMPNDPSFPTQYAVGGGAWGWTKTHTTQAWDVTQGSPSVVVAVLDTGLKPVADFSGQLVQGWNVLDGTTDTTSHAGSHGTYVAGVVGLALGNGRGNAGYCPGCRIMPVQVGTDAGAYVSDMASGITWAADHGARVANLSFAGAIPSATLDAAVAYARSKGVVVVAAAGNSNCDCTNYPAASPGVIGVAGTTSADLKQTDSNFGSWVAVAAPESNMTAWPTLNGAPGYAQVGGTSLAAPVVAGIAGLLFSASPGSTGAQVEQAIETTAAPVGFVVRYGRVDALAALNALGFADPQPSGAPVNTVAPQILLETNGDYDAIPLATAPQVGQILLRGQGAWNGSAPLTLGSVQWQRCDATGAGCVLAATAAKYAVQATDAGFTFRLRITVRNPLGSVTVSTSPSLPVGGASPPPPPAPAPANTAPPAIAGGVEVGQTLTGSAGTWSGSPTSYAYQWQRCDGTGAACSALTGATASTYVTQTGDIGSTLRVAVTASNASGSSAAVSAATAAITAPPALPPPPPAPPTSSTQTVTFTGSLNPAHASQSFTVTAGAGASNALLSFTKCSALTLAVSAGGSTIASVRGPSVLALAATLGAGGSIFTVSAGQCAFTLTVTTVTP